MLRQVMQQQKSAATLGALTFPIKLRCAAVADLVTEPGLEAALSRALGRCFESARTRLPARIALGGGVVLQPPYILAGELAGKLDNDATAQLLTRVSRAIEAAARARALPRWTASDPSRRIPTRTDSRHTPRAHEVTEVSERFDPARYNWRSSAYEIPSYDGGKTQANVVAKKDPLAKLKELRAKLITSLNALISDQTRMAFPDASRSKAVAALQTERGFFEGEDSWGQRISGEPRLIAQREQTYEATIDLLTLVRPTIAALDGAAARIAGAHQIKGWIGAAVGTQPVDAEEEEYLLAAYIELGNAYLAVPALDARLNKLVTGYTFGQENPYAVLFRLHDDALKESFQHLGFLNSYYRDPKVLMGIAGMRVAASRLSNIWKDLGKVRPPGDATQPRWPDLTDVAPKPDSILQYAQPGPQPSEQLQRIAEATAYASLLHRFYSKGAALPKSLEESGAAPRPDDVKVASALLFHLQVELIVLGLWQNIPVVEAVIHSDPAIIRTITGPTLDLRWNKLIFDLTDEFNKELNLANWAHPKIKTQVDDWQRRINSLFEEVKTAARNTALTKAAITMVFSLVITFGVSAWLNVVLNGSKLLLVLAEGAALTGINLGLAAMQGQQITVKGAALDFGLNTVLVGFGPLLKSFRTLAAIEEQLARSRPLLTALGQGAAMVALTTAGQFGISRLLDEQAQKAGGETSTTQMLTINFIFNTLAMLAGAGLHKFIEVPGGGPAINAKQLALKLQTEARLTVSETSAQKLIDLHSQLTGFKKAMVELQAAARRGTLTEDQYKMWQVRGELLVVEFEDIPELGQLLGTDIEPAEMKALLGRLRDALRRPFRAQVVLELPEFSGLTQVGDSRAWTYDPNRTTDTRRIDALKGRFIREGLTIRKLPLGDGWEAVDANGVAAIQVLPAGPRLGGLLEPPLRAMVSGERAQQGVDLIETQSAAPELSSAIKALVRGSGKANAQTILEAIASPGASALGVDDAAAWRGLGNYLRQGGDPARLAKLLTFRKGSISAEANNQYARRMLASMDGRDASTFPKTSQLLTFSGKATQEGLAAAQQQPFVANLEVLLENAAAKSPDSVKDLLPTLRFLNTSDSTPWLGLKNYFENGGNARVLNIALGFRGDSVSQFRPDLVNQSVAMIKAWTPEAIRGLEVLERLNATAKGKGRRYANLFLLRTEDPRGVAAALENLTAIESKIDVKDPASLTGLRKVLGALSAEDAPVQVEKSAGGQSMAKPAASIGNAPNVTGAVGALRAGAALAREFPGSDIFLRFETPHEVINEATGEVLGRTYDVEVVKRGVASAPGKLPPPDEVLRRTEVKEITSARSLSTPRVVHEFATDIAADIQVRTAALNANQLAPRPLQLHRWMIRGDEIRAQATRTLQARTKGFDLLPEGERNEDIDLEMRQMVKAALAPALNDPSLSGLLLGPYRATLNDPALPFVEFF